ncbi:alpha/beta fold hydrolase [Micromonospora sp. KC207]|nr:alpha/beta fold hydrolase [Micromonospora sp. KC207]
MWDAPRAELSRAGHQVLAVDQRGYGVAPLGDAPPSLDVVADDLARLLDRRGVSDVALVGCSMGGYVAMAFLRRHPGRTSALALLATRAQADDEATAAQRRAMAELLADPGSRSRVHDATVPKLLGATTRRTAPSVADRVRALVEAVDHRAVAWSQRAVAERQDATDVLRGTRVPAVVLAGDEDELVSRADARRLADLLPDGELVTLAGTGHLAPLEAPREVGAALRGLLDRRGAALSEVRR